MNKLILFVYIFTLSFFRVSGQATDYQLEKEPLSMPLSPNVASLGKYLQNPVGTYTGIPEINIPLWNVELGDVNFPIALNYHAGGIKVDEVASWVGLGWSLTGGGSISQVTRGKKDGSYDYSKIDKYRRDIMSYSEKVDYIVMDVFTGFTDSEPDIYILSFPGLNCRFIKDQNGEFVTQPIDKGIKIRRVSDNKWLVTDNKGVKYYFEEPNHTESLTEFKGADGVLHDIGQVNGVSTWYITKIVDNLNNEINFEYGGYGYHLTNKAVEHARVFDNSSLWCSGLEFLGLMTNTLYSEPVLWKISYKNTSLEFHLNSENRVDLPGALSLSQIKILNSDILTKSFKFHQSYFENAPVGSGLNRYYAFQNHDKYRLKLDSIRESNGTDFLPAYKFNYVTDVSLPYRLSNAQDHWGYANGKSNYEFVSYKRDGIQEGANKNIDHSYSKAFTLNEIVYPTGGKTRFEYEGNQMEAQKTVVVDHGIAELYRDNTVPGEEKERYEISTTFDLVDFSGSNLGSIMVRPRLIVQGFSITTDDSFEIILQKHGGGAPIRFYNDSPLLLEVGTYTVTILIMCPYKPYNQGFVSVDLALFVKKILTVDYIDGPGIRVKKIINSSIGSPDITTEFSYNKYNSTMTSGQIGIDPEYFTADFVKWTGPPGTRLPCNYKEYSSYSNYPLVNTNGSYVGYSFVTETKKDGIKSIKRELSFLNHSDFPDVLYGSFPYCPFSDQSYKRGLITTEMNYIDVGSNSFDLLSKKSYNYQKIAGSEKVVYGLKAAETMLNDGYRGNSQRYNEASINIYENVTDAFKLISDTTIFYNNVKDVISINKYTYNNRYLLARQESSSSKSGLLVRDIKYPFDYSGTLFSNMLTENAYALVVEDITSINGLSTKGLRNNYFERLHGSSLQFLLGSKDLLVNQTPVQSISFNHYDTYGNPLEIKRRSNLPPTVYLWGYNGQYPVAKIENASYAEVVAAVTQTVIDNLNALNHAEAAMAVLVNNLGNTLRSAAGLSKARVSTYTYKPLVGMTSETDPRGIKTEYKYDGFQRLKDVLDFDGNILKNYKYHYRP